MSDGDSKSGDAAGTVIEERFEIRGRLGAGGMGEVFEALDRERGEVVALKTLRYPNPASLYHFKKEFRTLQNVSHPNLVSLYELVVNEDQWFFTMELIQGDSLKDYVYPLDQTMPMTVGEQPEARPRLNVSRLRSALRQLASGVQAIHDAGRLHRDLKPSNVMVTRQGRLIILDFGVATELSPVMNMRSIDTGIAGTAAYMAPEQARGEPTQAASDWYAVGVILFEILTGRWPFTGSLARILIDKQFVRPPAPSSLVPNLPKDLEELALALLEPEGEDRPRGLDILRRLGGAEESGVLTVPEWQEGETLLVGRRNQLALLDDAFADTQEGRPVAVHVHGPSGIGKTALIHKFLHGLMKKSETVVLFGRCYEREMVPYKALDGLVDSLSRYLRTLNKGMIEDLLPRRIDALARLFPVLLRVETVAFEAEARKDSRPQTTDADSPDRPHLRRQAIMALRQLLTRIVSLHPLVLHVDDLQWADANSVAMLGEVMEEPEAPPVLLITSFRSEEIETRPFLEKLLEAADSTRQINVGALADAAAREYVHHILGPRPGTDYLVETIVQEAGGSPFFLEQLTRHALSSHSGVSAGLGLAEMLEERLQQLPRGSVELLDVLAAAGRPVGPAVAARAAGYEGKLRRLLATLRTACLVRSGGSDREEIELYHDRIREALLSRSNHADRRRVHNRLLAALEENGGDDPEMLFEQATRAGDRGRAARWARQAAEKAAGALAYERAAELYRHALELSDETTAQRQLRDRLADALAMSGRSREAADLHVELADATTGVTSLRYRRAAMVEYLTSGYTDRGLETADTVLHTLGQRSPTGPMATLASLALHRLRLRLRGIAFKPRAEDEILAEDLLRVDTFWSMSVGLGMADSIRAADFQARHLLLALKIGEERRIARAFAMDVPFRALSGRSVRRHAQTLYERALDLANQTGDAYAAALAMLQRGVAHYLSNEWRGALQLCDQAEVLFHEGGHCAVWEVATARRFALAALAFLGDMNELARRLPRQLEKARERGDLYHANELRTRLNFFWLAADEPGESERELREAAATVSQRHFYLPHLNLALARIRTRLYRGRGAEALAVAETEWPRFEASLLLRIPLVRVEAESHLARSLLAAATGYDGAERRRLARRATRLAGRIERIKMLIAPPIVRLIRAAAADLQGHRDQARKELRCSESEFETCDMRLHQLAARWRRGELEGGTEGEELRRRAAAEMQELGIRQPERMILVLAPGFAADP